tara:strand:- start:1144 stop:1431 length:288 start_codon:yes stop_codon:yes gene_type:complete
MNYKKLYGNLYSLRDQLYIVGDQTDGLEKEFPEIPELAEEKKSLIERTKKVERLIDKVWNKFNTKQKVFFPDHNVTVEYESELIDEIDLLDEAQK